MLAQPLLAERFDTHIDDMLACSEGYWHWDEKFHDLMVYDTQTCLLYIRRCSFFVNTSVYSKFCHDSVCRSKTCSMPPSSSRA